MKNSRISAVAAVAATLVLVPGVAFAGSNSSVSSTSGATAQFLHETNVIKVCDTEADGHSVYAQYKINNGSSKDTSQHNGGNNTCANKKITVAEKADLQIRAARQRDYLLDNFGAWKVGIA